MVDEVDEGRPMMKPYIGINLFGPVLLVIASNVQ